MSWLDSSSLMEVYARTIYTSYFAFQLTFAHHYIVTNQARAIGLLAHTDIVVPIVTTQETILRRFV